MIGLLFLGTGKTGRGAMAEAFAKARAADPAREDSEELRVLSAGESDASSPPLVREVMEEAGFDASRNRTSTLDSLRQSEFDVVVAFSGAADGERLLLPGNPEWVEWRTEPPLLDGDPEEVRASLQRCRDEIRRLVDGLFDGGYLEALIQAKRKANLILDNVSEGILAHDFDRKIFYFNKAAERITEFTREEMIGRDFHDVIPGGFCGGKCSFCDPGVAEIPDTLKKSLDFRTKSGGRRHVEMALKTMYDGRENPIGILASFHDHTREMELAHRLGEIEQFSGIIGRDPKMLEVFDLIRDVADSNISVLIQGDSGTGKELVAAAIHREGVRANKLFVPVNCGALPDGLLESELFGHVRGAFTGAIRDKKGRFELADGGTIFLDEIGDISPSMQVKLLRVLQEGTFERVGGEKTLRVNVRVISATNKDLHEEIRANRFREDLFYRLSVLPIQLPLLRERRIDIPLLAEHILKRSLDESRRTEVTLSPEAFDIMLSHDWPGNVRELQNWIQFALIKCKDDTILPEHLPLARTRPQSMSVSLKKQRKRKLSLSAVENALAQTNGNKLAAARVLGVSRATLYRFLDENK